MIQIDGDYSTIVGWSCHFWGLMCHLGLVLKHPTNSDSWDGLWHLFNKNKQVQVNKTLEFTCLNDKKKVKHHISNISTCKCIGAYRQSEWGLHIATDQRVSSHNCEHTSNVWVRRLWSISFYLLTLFIWSLMSLEGCMYPYSCWVIYDEVHLCCGYCPGACWSLLPRLTMLQPFDCWNIRSSHSREYDDWPWWMVGPWISGIVNVWTYQVQFCSTMYAKSVVILHYTIVCWTSILPRMLVNNPLFLLLGSPFTAIYSWFSQQNIDMPSAWKNKGTTPAGVGSNHCGFGVWIRNEDR